MYIAEHIGKYRHCANQGRVLKVFSSCDIFVFPHENNLKCINILEGFFVIIWSDVSQLSCFIWNIQ